MRSGKDWMERRSDGKAGPLPLPTVCFPLYVAFAPVDSVAIAREALQSTEWTSGSARGASPNRYLCVIRA